MGIHDRDYARPRQNPRFGGRGSTRNKMSVTTWLIIVCAGVFFVDPFLDMVLRDWLHMSTNHAIWGIQYWRFIGFQFLHANFQHLLFNMIGLFFFGPLVEQYLGGKRYLAFYLLCGIFGAVLYLILNLGGYIFGDSIPGLLFNDTNTPLVGASAGVFGVLLAGAFLAPNVKVLVMFILPMRLSTMAYALVALALFTVLFGRDNAGGEAAHLGGAAAGWYFIRNPHHLNGFFDFLGKADPTSKHFALKDKGSSHKEVDRILDKIHKKGLNSLSSKEKKILHDASRKGREDE
jgi:membrane associated rhomboid family serine protease